MQQFITLYATVLLVMASCLSVHSSQHIILKLIGSTRWGNDSAERKPLNHISLLSRMIGIAGTASLCGYDPKLAESLKFIAVATVDSDAYEDGRQMADIVYARLPCKKSDKIAQLKYDEQYSKEELAEKDTLISYAFKARLAGIAGGFLSMLSGIAILSKQPESHTGIALCCASAAAYYAFRDLFFWWNSSKIKSHTASVKKAKDRASFAQTMLTVHDLLADEEVDKGLYSALADVVGDTEQSGHYYKVTSKIIAWKCVRDATVKPDNENNYVPFLKEVRVSQSSQTVCDPNSTLADHLLCLLSLCDKLKDMSGFVGDRREHARKTGFTLHWDSSIEDTIEKIQKYNQSQEYDDFILEARTRRAAVAYLLSSR